jgi:hypothetical protein
LHAWQRLAQDLDISTPENMTREIRHSEVIKMAQELLQGKVLKRLVADVGEN